MARRATIIGEAADIDGNLWDVRESRATKHGFELLIGWPAQHRGPGFGGPRIIPTAALNAYFEVIRYRRDGSIYDLPVGHTAIKRIRRVLGHDYYLDNSEWWLERLEDLSSLTSVRFASLHGVSPAMASIVRRRLIGPKNRQPNWWREESNAALLASHLPRAYVADRLGVSIGTVGRLRWLLRREDQP